MAEHFFAVVIGSGQGGTPLATELAGAGKETALVEREHVGGTCINVGCTPTKTMVASARVAYLARRGAEYGVRTGPVTVDQAKVRQRKRDIVSEWSGGKRESLLHTEHLQLIDGEAHFAGPHSIEVRLKDGGTRQLEADYIFIDTGTRPVSPPIPGLSDVPFLDSTSIMELGAVPERLLVLGGGYVGLEFAQMFRRFGSDVTIVQREPQLLPREDEDVAEAVLQIMRDDGMEVLLKSEAIGVTGAAQGVELRVRGASGERTLSGTHLLVAVGRRANTEALDLPKAGVQTDPHGFVKVNERLETNVPGVYALGDVNGGPAFTHISYDDYRIVWANLMEGGNKTTTGRLVPYTVFIDPQLGRVGLTEQEARAQGRRVKVAKLNMDSVARAEEMDETRGFMKAIVDAESEQILGCAILGVEGGEIMSALQFAMMGNLRYPVVREAVLAHPTLAESLNNLFYSFEE